jgi:ribokinase
MAPQRIITVIGSLNTDLVTVTERVPQGGETLTSKSFGTGAGGKGANQAVAAARTSRSNPKNSASSDALNSDVDVKFIGAVGADPFGPSIVAGMKADGLDVSRIKVLEGQTTGVAVILVEEATGENRILVNPGANYTLRPEDFTKIEDLGTPKPDLVILQLEIPLDTVLTIIELCKAANVALLLNPAPAVPLPETVFVGLEHLVVNETEAAILSGRNVETVNADGFDWGVVTDEFLNKGVKNVVVTLGGKGSYSSGAIGKGSLLPANKVKVVDSTCAGDTFVGAYATFYVRSLETEGSWDLKDAVRKSSKASELTVQRQGAQDAIPWSDEINWD